MQDRTLLRIAMASGCIGLIMLLAIKINSKPMITPLERITCSHDDVVIQGIVQAKQQKAKASILEIGYDASIKTVVFDEPRVAVGDRVQLHGRVKEYKGKPEIMVDRITVMTH